MSTEIRNALAILEAQGYLTLSATEVVDRVFVSLMVRQGETITSDLASARARNVAAALVMTVVMP
jgi:hypothetical protein